MSLIDGQQRSGQCAALTEQHLSRDTSQRHIADRARESLIPSRDLRQVHESSQSWLSSGQGDITGRSAMEKCIEEE